jgi:lysophospholipid acyltransferase (LPLAT)-like uncharacterized protein
MYRVDNIPWYLKPFFWLYGYSLGIFFYLWWKMIYATCKVTFEGYKVPESQPVIYCIWHRDLVVYFSVFNRVKKQVWMNHPIWHMKPIHVMLHLTGVEHICLGSSGNDGKVALENVVRFLKQGYSTTVACDGPAGPAFVLKPGVLLMSRDSGVPVVPLRFTCSRYWQMGRWDRKVVPGLFSKITIHVGEPVFVTDLNFDESSAAVSSWLNGGIPF